MTFLAFSTLNTGNQDIRLCLSRSGRCGLSRLRIAPFRYLQLRPAAPVCRQVCASRIVHCTALFASTSMSLPSPIAAALLVAGDRFLTALLVNIILFVGAIVMRQRMLTARGLRHALFLGLLLWTSGGLRVYSLCFSFLVLGSLATRIGLREKQARGIAEKRGGARGPENLWGAAAAAAVCAVLGAVLPPVVLLCGFDHAVSAFVQSLANIAYVAAISTKMSDTLSSEIGKAYGGDTYLLTTLKKVPRGTEGGVSVEGTLAGVVGSAIAALWAAAVGILAANNGVSVAFAVLVVVAAAFVATTAESVIGATLQKQRSWSNEFVNLLNTSIGACASVVIVLAGRLFGLA